MRQSKYHQRRIVDDSRNADRSSFEQFLTSFDKFFEKEISEVRQQKAAASSCKGGEKKVHQACNLDKAVVPLLGVLRLLHFEVLRHSI